MKNKTFIIAEAGVNHNGKLPLAKKLVDIAVRTGADAVKFQTFKADNVCSIFAEKLKYQKKSFYDNESQVEMLRKYEMKDSEFLSLYKYCKKKKIIFMSTPKDIKSAKFLNKIGMKIFKIGSSEIFDYELLQYIAGLNKKTILSTGMSNLNEIKTAAKFFGKRNKNLTILHCVSIYPTPLKDVNLRSMETIKKALGFDVGFSDHTKGIVASLSAVSRGAKIIEKHLTISNKMPGPDHSSSLEEKEFKTMVKSIRGIEELLGSNVKQPTKTEKKQLKILRRGLVFLRDMKRGEILKVEDIGIKRPMKGLEPKYKNKIIGSKLNKNVVFDQPILRSLLS